MAKRQRSNRPFRLGIGVGRECRRFTLSRDKDAVRLLEAFYKLIGVIYELIIAEISIVIKVETAQSLAIFFSFLRLYLSIDIYIWPF